MSGEYHLFLHPDWPGAADTFYGVLWPGLSEQSDRRLDYIKTPGRRHVTAFEPTLLPHIDFLIPEHF